MLFMFCFYIVPSAKSPILCIAYGVAAAYDSILIIEPKPEYQHWSEKYNRLGF